MNSRMDKYYDKEPVIGSRASRNQTLYQEISHDDLDHVNLSSNAHVIGDNDSEIDIEKIKEILEKKYPKEQKKSRILEDTKDVQDEKTIRDETKEYDINAIIEKAKLDKEVDYERDRLKKIHDTQYDILKGLNVDEDKEDKIQNEKEQDLMNLINTITEKELTREVNPLDILTDLKGSDNTVVLDGIKEEMEKQEPKNKKDELKKEIDKTFYTNSLSFTKSDFDDFNDLKENVKSNKILVRVLLIVVAIALIAGILFLVNHIFTLNWF